MLGVDPQQFSWLREVGIPAFFVMLGAGVGLLASQYGEKLKAKRDDLKAKQDKESFLRAIGMELDAERPARRILSRSKRGDRKSKKRHRDTLRRNLANIGVYKSIRES